MNSTTKFLDDQSQYSQQEGFSMSRPEDEDNVDVYPRPGSPTGLSGSFPRCQVAEAGAGDEPLEPEKEKEKRDLLSDVLRDAARKDDLDGQVLEDAQRLEPSLDPQPLPDPSYHDMQPSRSAEEILLDSSEASLSSSRKREETMEKLGEEYYYPPNQLVAVRSGANMDVVDEVVDDVEDRPHKRLRPGEGVNDGFLLHGATSVGPPPGPIARRITSAVGRANYSPVLDLTKNGESGFIPHDFPWEGPDEVVVDPTPEELGEGRFLAVKELSSSQVFRTVSRENLISFLVVVKDAEDQLYIPSVSFFDRVVNKMEESLLVGLPELRSLFWCATKMSGCGFLELSVDPVLEEWRLALSSLDLGGLLKVDTFPKDSLLLGPDITILLKEAHLEYKIKWMGRALVGRNTPLKGSVRVVCSKRYHAHDITRHAINMDGWQMVYLAGDCVFMEFLSRCPVTSRFHVGPGSVVIRGGIRKPAFLSDQARAQFTWVRPGTTFPSLPLQPLQQLVPTVSTSSSSSSAAPLPKKGPGKAGRRGPKTINLVSGGASGSTGDSAFSEERSPGATGGEDVLDSGILSKSLSAPSSLAGGRSQSASNKKSLGRPKNRSARLKAKTIKAKNCC